MNKMKKLKASKEFVVGKNKIGWINDRFNENFGKVEFEAKPMPKFQKLGRYMTDSQIESELKPGFCDLGDILVFMENAPEECKDGRANLFYTPSFVVYVRWFGSSWLVYAWKRDDNRWRADRRVFSPATDAVKTKPSDLGSFVPRAEFDEFKRRVEAVLKLGGDNE